MRNIPGAILSILLLTILPRSLTQEDSNLEKLLKHVPGIPGEDYPIFSTAPDTSFLCEVQPVEGYYADPEADCQLYHVCSDSGDGIFVTYDFLCPNGTIFNQEEFVCDWWFNVDCSKAEDFYFLNIEVAEKNAERQRLREEERAAGQERERSELSADEITALRNGEGLPEEKRSSKSVKNVASNVKKQFGQSSAKKSFNQFSATTRRPKNAFGNQFSFRTTTVAPRNPFNARPKSTKTKTSFGRPAKTFGTFGLQKGTKTTIGIKSNVGANKFDVKSSQSQATNSQRPGRRRKKSRLRKAKNSNTSANNSFKSKPFTNFGNGQSRFGNF